MSADDVAFLVRSPHRGAVLAALAGTPADRSTLRERVGVPRGIVVSESPTVREWVAEEFDRLRADATALSAEAFRVPDGSSRGRDGSAEGSSGRQCIGESIDGSRSRDSVSSKTVLQEFYSLISYQNC